MKNLYIPIALIFAIVIIFTTGGFITTNKSAMNNTIDAAPAKGFAVVELFTSEGCSSCPSADETVAKLLSKNMENVYVLAYHVDYWNRLEWKDPFSKAEYSQRQSQYASKFNLNSVYTPQVIVNGSSEFVGSDENKLTSAIKNNLNKQAGNNVSITTTRSDNKIIVHYEIRGNEAAFLNLALVQPEATISVKRGENGGRTLHHVNIVRVLRTIDADAKGSVIIDVPQELGSTPLQLIAYTQAKQSFQISGADKKPI